MRRTCRGSASWRPTRGRAGSGPTAWRPTRTSWAACWPSACSSSRAPQGHGRWTRLVRMAVFGLGVAALFLTFSRAAWIAFAVGLAVAIVMLAIRRDRPGLRRWVAAALTAGVIGAVLAVPFAAIPGGAGARVRAGPDRDPLDRRTAGERRSRAARDRRAPAAGDGSRHHAAGDEADRPDLRLRLPADPRRDRRRRGRDGRWPEPCATSSWSWRPGWRWSEPGAAGRAGWRARRPAIAAVTVVGLFDFYPWTASAGRTWAWILLGLWVVAYRVALAASSGRRPGAGSR